MFFPQCEAKFHTHPQKTEKIIALYTLIFMLSNNRREDDEPNGGEQSTFNFRPSP